MVKVPSDPAQITAHHAVFRVQFRTAQQTRSPRVARYATAAARAWDAPPAASDGRRVRNAGATAVEGAAPVAGGAAGPSGALVARRRAPVVWSGRSAPGDPGATGLLQAVRTTGRTPADAAPHGLSRGPDGSRPANAPHDAGTTRLLPATVDDADATVALPVVGAPRGPVDAGVRPLPRPGGARRGADRYDDAHDADGPDPYGKADRGRYDDDPYDYAEGRYDGAGRGPYDTEADAADRDGADDEAVVRRRGTAAGRRRGAESVRHAYYPGRRMNLGLVLLPLRLFLGLLSAYAGMSKLCDPAYFDGDARGSLARSLRGLHPWALAEPLRDMALQHPVGAGLTLAFLQVIVGLLTVLGLWQRVAAAVGALLAAALVITVSWQRVPGYDAPDIIYLAAWSPLVIAGAPVYSVDGRLTSEAWRTLGPRAELWELRRRMLRRGALLAALVTGVTFLLGALLGGAVRDADRVRVPGPGHPARNALPGSPLPEEPSTDASRSQDPTASGRPGHGASTDPSESATAGTDAAKETAGSQGPGRTWGTGTGGGRPQPARPRTPATSAGPSSSGGSGASTTSGTGTGTTNRSGGGSGSLVGGLLG